MNSWNGIHLHHGARNLPQSREGVWFVVKCVLGSRTHLKQPPAGSVGTQGREGLRAQRGGPVSAVCAWVPGLLSSLLHRYRGKEYSLPLTAGAEQALPVVAEVVLKWQLWSLLAVTVSNSQGEFLGTSKTHHRAFRKSL